MKALTTYWTCLTCPESGEGDDGDKQADDHGKATGHSTATAASDIRAWNRKGNGSE